MSRRVSIFGSSFASGPVWQSETTAYMTAIAVPADGTLYYPATIYQRTGLQLWQAFDAFVVTGKAAGWWAKLIALYPYIGGTAARHKFNAVNPVDSNAAFRAQFFGSVTHSATGVQGNGVNGYANTFFNDQSAAINRDDIGITFYSRTGGFATGVDMGAVDSSTYLWLFVYRGVSNSLIGAYDNSVFSVTNALTGDALGAFTVTRHPSAVDIQSFYRNGNPIADRTSFAATAYTNLNMFLMCRNIFGSPNLYSQRNYSAHVIHEGMTAADVASFHTALQTLQTALGRQV